MSPDPGSGRPDTGRSLPRRLIAESAPGSARWYLVTSVSCGLALTGLILAQAGLLAHVLATAASGVGASALTASLVSLLLVVGARAAAAYGGEVSALRAAVAVKDRLRTRLLTRALDRGPHWLGRQRSGELSDIGDQRA